MKRPIGALHIQQPLQKRHGHNIMAAISYSMCCGYNGHSLMNASVRSGSGVRVLTWFYLSSTVVLKYLVVRKGSEPILPMVLVTDMISQWHCSLQLQRRYIILQYAV